MSSEALVAAFTLLSFGIIVAAVAFGSAIGDGIVASKAVEAIARQPEARPNIFTFLFLGVGVLEAFPIIGLGLAFYMLLVVVGVPNGLMQHFAALDESAAYVSLARRNVLGSVNQLRDFLRVVERRLLALRRRGHSQAPRLHQRPGRRLRRLPGAGRRTPAEGRIGARERSPRRRAAPLPRAEPRRRTGRPSLPATMRKRRRRSSNGPTSTRRRSWTRPAWARIVWCDRLPTICSRAPFRELVA